MINYKNCPKEMALAITPEDISSLKYEERKIELIKLIRHLSECSLKYAKDWVFHRWNDKNETFTNEFMFKFVDPLRENQLQQLNDVNFRTFVTKIVKIDNDGSWSDFGFKSFFKAAQNIAAQSGYSIQIQDPKNDSLPNDS
jgi:hypothetical protein